MSQVREESLDLQDLRDSVANQDSLDHLDSLDQLDLLDHKAKEENLEKEDRLAYRVGYQRNICIHSRINLQ